MKELEKKDLEKIEELHSIYSKEIPTFMREIINTKEMQRLKYVGQNCGRDYINDKLQTFEYNYSRLDHSIGVGMIVWNFTKSPKQAIAGLLHDIATPTFSHVIDYYNNDEKTQTSTEDDTENIIRKSDEINSILKKYNIKLEEISDYALYPIADNKMPQLSADRLEYNFYMGTSRGIITMKEAQEIYKDIIIVKNEKGIDEMCFKSIEMAKKMAEISLDNGTYMSGPISTITNSFLSDILKITVQQEIIEPRMFMQNTEEEIVNILNKSDNVIIKNSWEKFKNFEKIYISKEKLKDKYSIKSTAKKRYTNPLVKKGTNIYRITDLDNSLNEQILKFIKEENIYLSI